MWLQSAMFFGAINMIQMQTTCNPLSPPTTFANCISSQATSQITTFLQQYDPLPIPGGSQTINGFIVTISAVQVQGLSSLEAPSVSTSMPSVTTLNGMARISWASITASAFVEIAKPIFGFNVPIFKATPTIVVTNPNAVLTGASMLTISSSGVTPTVSSVLISLNVGDLRFYSNPGGLWFLFHILTLFVTDKLLTNWINSLWNDFRSQVEQTVQPILMTTAETALAAALQ